MEKKLLAAKDYALIDLLLDGSLSLASVRQLAAMQQVALPGSSCSGFRSAWAAGI